MGNSRDLMEKPMEVNGSTTLNDCPQHSEENETRKLLIQEVSRRYVEDLKAQDGESDQDSFFVVDLGEVHRLHQSWTKSLGGVKPFYALKCNYDRKVLTLLAKLGTGFDCSCRSEIEQVLDIGVEPDRIIFANPCKMVSQLRYAYRMGVRKMTFDATDELDKIKSSAPNAELILRIMTDDSSSVNQLSTKYGAPLEAVHHLLMTARDLSLNVVGVSFHIGSAATDPGLFVKAIRDSRAVIDLAMGLGFSPKIVDVGGGFSHESFSQMAEPLYRALREYFPSGDYQFIAEPGRFFVASAFTLICQIIARRKIPGPDGRPKHMLFLNDGVYGNFIDNLLSKWRQKPYVLISAQRQSVENSIVYSIWGPTCDSIDIITEEASFSQILDVGDWLYFQDMGAYTSCLATSFNGSRNTSTAIYISSESDTIALLGDGSRET